MVMGSCILYLLDVVDRCVHKDVISYNMRYPLFTTLLA
jgi:hypothetical protein